DLSDTLVDRQYRPFPHVPEALTALAALVGQGGKRLPLALVSDFTMPAPPPTPARVQALFADYLRILDATGLRPFFEPVSRHVTLSTHAGVTKPDAEAFTTPLRRLGS